jgi:hypothetical protein
MLPDLRKTLPPTRRFIQERKTTRKLAMEKVAIALSSGPMMFAWPWSGGIA